MVDREFMRETFIALLCVPVYAVAVIGFFMILDIMSGGDIVLFR